MGLGFCGGRCFLLGGGGLRGRTFWFFVSLYGIGIGVGVGVGVGDIFR